MCDHFQLSGNGVTLLALTTSIFGTRNGRNEAAAFRKFNIHETGLSRSSFPNMLKALLFILLFLLLLRALPIRAQLDMNSTKRIEKNIVNSISIRVLFKLDIIHIHH
jgi:hypothetical protein